MVGRDILCLLRSRRVLIGILWMVRVGWIHESVWNWAEVNLSAMFKNFSRLVVLESLYNRRSSAIT